MAKTITAYDLFLSCPSDVKQFLPLIREEIDRFNRGYGNSHNLEVRIWHYTTNAYASMGKHPQEIVNEQIPDVDIVVGVFWTRFGTPTKKYQSGTEEEIEHFYQDGKKIFLYFLNKDVPLSQINISQYQKVQEFKARHDKDSLFWEVDNEFALVRTISDHLEKYFDSLLKKNDSFSSSTRPYLPNRNGKRKILWVDDRPENNRSMVNLLRIRGLDVFLALSTSQALELFNQFSFSLIISDMGRVEGSQEGYVLLEEVRKVDKTIPFIIFASYASSPEHNREAMLRGAQASIDDATNLLSTIYRFV